MTVDTHKFIDETVAKMKKEFPELKTKEMEKILTNIIEKNMSLREAMGYDEARIEGEYAQAYYQFKSGLYKQALEIFSTLFLICPNDPRFLMCVASCNQMLKKYGEAADLYEKAGVLYPENSLAFYFAAQCYLELDNKERVIAALEQFTSRGKDKPEYDLIMHRATLMLESFKSPTT